MSLFFDKDLKIKQVGNNLQFLFGNHPLRGEDMNKIFTLRRPLSTKFTYDDVSCHSFTIFLSVIILECEDTLINMSKLN